MQNILKLLLFVSIFSVFIFAKTDINLTEIEKEFIKNNPEVSLGSGIGFEPFVIKNGDGTLSGHDIDLLDIISKKTGLKFKLNVDDWTNVQKKTKEKELDGFFASGYDKSRENFANRSHPYLKLTTLVITRADNKQINTIDSLEGKTAAIQKGNLLFLRILKESGKNINIIEVDTIADTIRAVVDKKVDFTILDESVFYLANTIGLSSLIQTPFSMGKPFDVMFWFRKDYPQLQTIVNKALDSIDIKTKLQIRNRWFSNMNSNSLSLDFDEKLFLENNPAITFGVPSAPPFIFKEDGEFKGYLYELINIIAKKNNFEAKFVVGDYKYLIDNLKNKNIDVIPAISEIKKRKADMLFTKKESIKRTFSIYTTLDKSFTKPQDYFGKRVGVVNEWKSTKYFMEKYPQINFIQYDTPKELMKAIAHERIEGAVNIVSIAEYINKNMMFNNLKQSCTLVFDSPLKMAVRKDFQELQSIIDKTLDSYSVIKEIDLLKQKWFGIEKYSRYNLLSKTQKRYLELKKEIKVCVDPGWVPYDFVKDGKHLGVGSDLLKNMSKNIPVELNLVISKSWSETLDNIKNKKCDIIPLAMKTKPRQEYLNFTSSYLTLPVVLASNQDEEFVDNIETLVDKKIAVVKGFAIYDIFKEKYPNLKIVEVDSIKEGLELVQKKKVFGFADTLSSIKYISNDNLIDDIKIVAKFNDNYDLSVAVRDDEMILLDIFQILSQSINESYKQKVINEWTSIDNQKNIQWDVILEVIGIFMVLVLFLLYRQYELKKVVNQEIEKSRKKDNLIFQQNKMASLGQMVGNIAHQWRQPLQELTMTNNVILAKLEKDKLTFEELKGEIKDSQKTIQDMSKLIGTFERLYIKKDIGKDYEFSLKDIVSDIKHIFDDEFRLSQIEFKENIDENIVLKYDYDLLKQVFLLILQNSVYFLNHRDIKNKTVSIKAYKQNGKISIKISDNAKGIEDDILPHIFEYNFSKRDNDKNSTGLGLYIVKLIVQEKFDGTISGSNNHNGACFTINLAS
ncbi:MAG: transporter substrate-binding domain-containing protein [Campylobacterota bacterium]|nr:transporter substrate-binding domain-containing protein [Campylobacterota bacterium]